MPLLARPHAQKNGQVENIMPRWKISKIRTFTEIHYPPILTVYLKANCIFSIHSTKYTAMKHTYSQKMAHAKQKTTTTTNHR